MKPHWKHLGFWKAVLCKEGGGRRKAGLTTEMSREGNTLSLALPRTAHETARSRLFRCTEAIQSWCLFIPRACGQMGHIALVGVIVQTAGDPLPKSLVKKALQGDRHVLARSNLDWGWCLPVCGEDSEPQNQSGHVAHWPVLCVCVSLISLPTHLHFQSVWELASAFHRWVPRYSTGWGLYVFVLPNGNSILGPLCCEHLLTTWLFV